MKLEMLLQNQWALAFVLNTFLIFCSYRIPLLTRSGWVSAGILGTILWGCIGWNGWISVVIYLTLGSLVTRIGFKSKQKSGLAEGRGGKRGPENVWGSASTGTFIALLIGIGFASEQLLLIAFSASFAAKLADTFGSEIGKRWGKSAFLITSFRKVPVGTDGAISIEGTLASALGSVLMTISMASVSLISSLNVVILVFLTGFIATLFESLLGAVVQNRYRYLTNEVINALQTLFAALLAIILSISFNVLNT